MSMPTYEELLKRLSVEIFELKQIIEDDHLKKLSFKLDRWELLAQSLELPTSEIERIRNQGDAQQQRDEMLQQWKKSNKFTATYEALARALFQISRTDLVEIVVSLCQSLRDVRDQTILSVVGEELSLATPPSQDSCSGVEEVPSLSAACPKGLITAVKNSAPSLTNLEEEFNRLVTDAEATLEKYDVGLNTITRRFSMLPQSVKRRHQMDENYAKIRPKILASTSIKNFFDNLTELKHWNFMMPDTFAHVLKDIKIDDIHQKIDKYKERLLTFKQKTKLRDLIGTRFPVPDHCIELTMEVKGWEDKTIEEAEKAVGNIMRCAAYGQHVPLGWKSVETGSVKLTLILLEPIKIASDMLLVAKKYSGIVSIELDGDIIYGDDTAELKDKATGNSKSVQGSIWQSTGTTPYYSAGGGRDILIISADPPPHQPEAVPRRPGQLTEEDKQKLLRQAVTSDCQSEMDIVRARCELDKRCKICDVMSGHFMYREEALRSITYHLNVTKNDEGLLWYIGAGRRDTGDWCFEDGFITFRDIAQLYLQSKLRGRVLTIVSDCSYSGRWARDCMEFLDEQGVQPCGHKAREKGVLIKLCTSCKLDETPTEYRFSISGVDNDKNTGMMNFWSSKQLLDTQTTYGIDSSLFNCNNKSITEQCTLKPGYTWKSNQQTGKSGIPDYGQLLHTGWGADSLGNLMEQIEQ